MMQTPAFGSRRKQFVEVLVNHGIDGSVEPKRITMACGKVFEIDMVQDPYYKTPPEKRVDVPRRYPIMVRGKKTYLYEDHGRWWVMMKE